MYASTSLADYPIAGYFLICHRQWSHALPRPSLHVSIGAELSQRVPSWICMAARWTRSRHTSRITHNGSNFFVARRGQIVRVDSMKANALPLPRVTFVYVTEIVVQACVHGRSRNCHTLKQKSAMTSTTPMMLAAGRWLLKLMVSTCCGWLVNVTNRIEVRSKIPDCGKVKPATPLLKT